MLILFSDLDAVFDQGEMQKQFRDLLTEVEGSVQAFGRRFSQSTTHDVLPDCAIQAVSASLYLVNSCLSRIDLF